MTGGMSPVGYLQYMNKMVKMGVDGCLDVIILRFRMKFMAHVGCRAIAIFT